mmetsp:Transcript_31485/g.75211  ORF Transcript_31485/g.75211 Transcript_31485/m.75211 type:complete len:233 (+) Transcript_31485:239-937(+)
MCLASSNVAQRVEQQLCFPPIHIARSMPTIVRAIVHVTSPRKLKHVDERMTLISRCEVWQQAFVYHSSRAVVRRVSVRQRYLLRLIAAHRNVGRVVGKAEEALDVADGHVDGLHRDVALDGLLRLEVNVEPFLGGPQDVHSRADDRHGMVRAPRELVYAPRTFDAEGICGRAAAVAYPEALRWELHVRKGRIVAMARSQLVVRLLDRLESKSLVPNLLIRRSAEQHVGESDE